KRPWNDIRPAVWYCHPASPSAALRSWGEVPSSTYLLAPVGIRSTCATYTEAALTPTPLPHCGRGDFCTPLIAPPDAPGRDARAPCTAAARCDRAGRRWPTASSRPRAAPGTRPACPAVPG